MFKSNGKGKRARLVLSVATVAVLTACSSSEDRKMANRGFEYENARLEGRAFLIPSGLSAPTFNNQYDIPALPQSNRSGPLGANVDVRPPTQLLSVVPGSQVVPAASEPTMAFYALSADQGAQQDVWSSLLSFLAKNKVSIEQQDQQNGVLQTGWFDSAQMLDGANEDDEDANSRQRYQFTLTNDVERHAANVSARVLDNKETVDGETSNTLTPTDAQRYAARVLNQFSLYYGQQVKARDQRNSSAGIGLEIGQDNNNVNALIAEESFDQVWRRLNQVLPMYGFAINDAQQSLGLIEVEYTKPSNDVWKAKGVEPLQLEEARFSFQLGEIAGDKTSITLLDKDKNPVSTEANPQAYTTLSKVLAKGPVDQGAAKAE
ncbi:MAG: outer membrane protein assembly factor BamC [Aeromonas sp.]